MPVKKLGMNLYCGVPTKERVLYDNIIGWTASGDSLTMLRGEPQTICKKLNESIRDGGPEKSGMIKDPFMLILENNGVFKFDDDRVGEYYRCFGSKTQGEPYHVGLLAIACLIEDRLNHNAICDGDITYGQCELAIEYANRFLKKPIGLPLRCKMSELYERIKTLPLNDDEKIKALENTYLGKKNKKYYDFVKNNFSQIEKKSFLENLFKKSTIGTYGGTTNLMKALNYGFEITEICEAFKKSLQEKDFDKNPYEIFIKEILDTKIYLEEKDMRDCLHIDEEEKGTYSVAMQFAQIVFMGARNNNVERFVTLTELETKLKSSIGDKCDITKIITEYLKTEKEKTDVSSQKILNDWRDKEIDEMNEVSKEYDIYDPRQFLDFEMGNKIEPNLLESLKTYISFYKSALQEEYYIHLMENDKDWKDRCKFLIERNKSLALMKKEWERIFKDIKNDSNTFSRYYPMIRVAIDENVQHLVRSYVVNDNFYVFCQELVKDTDGND